MARTPCLRRAFLPLAVLVSLSILGCGAGSTVKTASSGGGGLGVANPTGSPSRCSGETKQSDFNGVWWGTQPAASPNGHPTVAWLMVISQQNCANGSSGFVSQTVTVSNCSKVDELVVYHSFDPAPIAVIGSGFEQITLRDSTSLSPTYLLSGVLSGGTLHVNVKSDGQAGAVIQFALASGSESAYKTACATLPTA